MKFASHTADEIARSNFAPARASYAETLENWLDSERERLPLLIPVALGSGVSFWQAYGPANDLFFAILCIGLCGIGLSLRGWTRLSTVIITGGCFYSRDFV